MVKCRMCQWCLKDITDDFVLTEDSETMHEECYELLNIILAE